MDGKIRPRDIVAFLKGVQAAERGAGAAATIARAQAQAATAAMAQDLSGGATDPKSARRGGRLPKDGSEAKKADLLATIRQHDTLKDDPAKLARLVGVSESTARRWMAEEDRKYAESKAANPEPPEE